MFRPSRGSSPTTCPVGEIIRELEDTEETIEEGRDDLGAAEEDTLTASEEPGRDDLAASDPGELTLLPGSCSDRSSWGDPGDGLLRTTDLGTD